MTEAEWLACRDPLPLLKHLQPGLWDRKTLLLICACGDHLGEPLLRLGNDWLDVRRLLESCADGKSSEEEIAQEADGLFYDLECGYRGGYVVFSALFFGAWLPGNEDQQYDFADWPQHHAEFAVQADFVREIFGNPFRPVRVDPLWLTRNDAIVPRIARGIDAERAFDRMPILHDALLDAGCNDEALLSHCRHPEGHVRGCWALDLILGKE
jgi:hypothetical protein